jgi:small subunit ribosomal protein S16
LLRIRLSRVGKKKQPAYRIVVADSRSPRDGAFLKIIGHYNPLTDPVTLVVKEDEAVHWLAKGARPSDTAAKLLTRIGVMERAGRQPVRYEGKAVPPAPKKEAKAAAPPEAKAAPVKATAEPEVGAETTTPAAEAEAPEAAAPESAEAVAEPAAKETLEESEASASEPEVTPDEDHEPEAKEADAEPEATNDEQSQEQAENQESPA